MDRTSATAWRSRCARCGSPNSRRTAVAKSGDRRAPRNPRLHRASDLQESSRGAAMDLQAAIERLGNPWMATVLAAIIGVALVLIGCAIADRVLRRLARFSVVLTTVLERSARAARVVIVLVVLQFIWTAAPDDLRGLPAVSRITTLL